MREVKKEEVKEFLGKIPFLIITKGTIMTVSEVIGLNDSSITFYDKFHNKTIVNIKDISTIQELKRGGINAV